MRSERLMSVLGRLRSQGGAILLLVLILAVPTKIGHKLSVFWLSVTHKAWASKDTVERIAARKIDAIPIACGVLGSLIVPVEDAIGGIQLHRFSLIQFWQTSYRLPYLWECFDSNIQGEALTTLHLHVAIPWRRIINERVASPFLWNNLQEHPIRKDVIGASCADVFKGELHIARVEACFGVASKWLEKCSWKTMDDDWHVLHPRLPSAYVNIRNEIADTGCCGGSQGNYFYLPKRTGLSPVLSKGLLFLFCGFLGLIFGLALLLATLCLDGTVGTAVIATFVVVLSVCTFHLGLVALLGEW